MADDPFDDLDLCDDLTDDHDRCDGVLERLMEGDFGFKS